MKKLLVIAAIATVAVSANAASVTWTMSNFYKPVATQEGTMGQVSSGTLFGSLTDFKTFNLYVIDYSSGSAGERVLIDSSSAEAFSDGSLASGTVLWDQDTAISMRETYGIPSGTSQGKVYLQLEATYSDGKYDYVYVNTANKGLKNITSGGQEYTFLGSKSGVWTATAAAPEPTSGLLLILGVAGLALRRRRA